MVKKPENLFPPVPTIAREAARLMYLRKIINCVPDLTAANKAEVSELGLEYARTIEPGQDFSQNGIYERLTISQLDLLLPRSKKLSEVGRTPLHLMQDKVLAATISDFRPAKQSQLPERGVEKVDKRAAFILDSALSDATEKALLTSRYSTRSNRLIWKEGVGAASLLFYADPRSEMVRQAYAQYETIEPATDAFRDVRPRRIKTHNVYQVLNSVVPDSEGKITMEGLSLTPQQHFWREVAADTERFRTHPL